MIIMSLRGAPFATKQSPTKRGDCFATARNDIWVKVNALRELQSASGDELRPLFGRTLMPSVPDRTVKHDLRHHNCQEMVGETRKRLAI